MQSVADLDHRRNVSAGAQRVPAAYPVKAVLFDLCGVLLYAQDDAGRAAIEAAAGCSGPAFWEAYWTERPGYDTGLDGASYWARVAARIGRPIADVAATIEADVTSCARLDPGMAALARKLLDGGVRLGLLSNITPDMLRRVEAEQPWLEEFDAVVWSCFYRSAKPDPMSFRLAQRHLGVPYDSILFVDDNPANIVAAGALGMRTHLFDGRAGLEAVLATHPLVSKALR